jgi:dimethylargininase
MWTAITRGVSPAIARCELTCIAREPIDVDRAELQHARYEELLRALSVEVVSLPVESELPDSVFVEDTAVVLDDFAIITRPGSPSRRAETARVREALERHRRLFEIEAPGTIDGGDVLMVGRRIFVGQSTRTNRTAIEQLADIVRRFGFTVETLDVRGCLHLKSAVTQVGPETLLINDSLVDRGAFPGLRCIPVDPSEPAGANALLVGETVVSQPVFPRTVERLREAGLNVAEVDMSELAKAEGALTCCSLLFPLREALNRR